MALQVKVSFVPTFAMYIPYILSRLSDLGSVQWHSPQSFAVGQGQGKSLGAGMREMLLTQTYLPTLATSPPCSPPEEEPQTPAQSPDPFTTPTNEAMVPNIGGLVESAPVCPDEEKSAKGKWAQVVSASAPAKKKPPTDMATLVLQYKR